MKNIKLGEKESALLAWVARHAPASAAEIVAGWGAEQNVARTTVTTMLERLRAKGYLKREKIGATFSYAPRDAHETQLRGLVGRFVEKTLGGSVEPFVAYLNEADLSETDIAQLRAIVGRLDAEKSEGDAQ